MGAIFFTLLLGFMAVVGFVTGMLVLIVQAIKRPTGVSRIRCAQCGRRFPIPSGYVGAYLRCPICAPRTVPYDRIV